MSYHRKVLAVPGSRCPFLGQPSIPVTSLRPAINALNNGEPPAPAEESVTAIRTEMGGILAHLIHNIWGEIQIWIHENPPGLGKVGRRNHRQVAITPIAADQAHAALAKEKRLDKIADWLENTMSCVWESHVLDRPLQGQQNELRYEALNARLGMERVRFGLEENLRGGATNAIRTIWNIFGAIPEVFRREMKMVPSLDDLDRCARQSHSLIDQMAILSFSDFMALDSHLKNPPKGAGRVRLIPPPSSMHWDPGHFGLVNGGDSLQLRLNKIGSDWGDSDEETPVIRTGCPAGYAVSGSTVISGVFEWALDIARGFYFPHVTDPPPSSV